MDGTLPVLNLQTRPLPPILRKYEDLAYAFVCKFILLHFIRVIHLYKQTNIFEKSWKKINLTNPV